MKHSIWFSLILILLLSPACGALAGRRTQTAVQNTGAPGASAPQGTERPQRTIHYIEIAQDPQSNSALEQALQSSHNDQEKRQILFLIKRNELQEPQTRTQACDYLITQTPEQYNDPDLVTAHALYSLSCASQAPEPTHSSQTLTQQTVQNLDNPWIAPQDEGMAWEAMARSALQGQNIDDALYYLARSYALDAKQTTKAIAFANAAKLNLSPERATRLLEQKLPPLAHAALGFALLSRCLHTQDPSCPIAARDSVEQALNAVGEETKASALLVSSEQSPNTTSLLAAVLPLSGNSMRLGRAMLGAMLMAQGVFDRTDNPFSLLFLDSQSSAQGAASALLQAKELGAIAVVGPLNPAEVQAAALAAQQQALPLLAFSVDDKFINPYAYQFSSSIQMEAQTLAGYLPQLGVKRIVTVAQNSNYAKSASEALRTESTKYGVQMLAPVFFESNQADLAQIAKKIGSSGADAIFLPIVATTAERLVSFLNQENIWCMAKKPSTYKGDTRKFVRCLSLSSWAPVAENHGYRALQNSLYLDYAQVPRTLGLGDSDFATKFEALYKRKPALHEVLAYSAILLLKRLPSRERQSAQSLNQSLSMLGQGSPFVQNRYHVIPSLFVVEQSTTQVWKPQV